MAQAAQSRGTDAITLIKEDHRIVEGLFKQFESSDGHDHERRRAIVDDIVRELSIHAAIEEQIFYPAVQRNLPEGDRLVDESLHEHQEVKEILSILEKTEPGDTGYAEKVHALIADVRHHVQEEETDILPKLESAIDRDRLVQMGEAMEAAKGVAPTHPHPRSPNRPPANMVMGAMAGAVDRIKDAATGRDER